MSSDVVYAFLFSYMALFSSFCESVILIIVKNCHRFYIAYKDLIGGSGRREGWAQVLGALRMVRKFSGGFQ